MREDLEVLVDGLADDFAQHFVPAEKVFEINFSLLNGDSGERENVSSLTKRRVSNQLT